MKSLSEPSHPARKVASYLAGLASLVAAAGVVFLIQRMSVQQENRIGQETLLRSTLVNSDVAAIILDKEGKIVMVTPELLKMTGYTSAELVGNSPDVLIPIAYRAMHAKGYAMRNADVEHKHQVYCQLKRKDGSTFQVTNNVFSYEGGGIAIITPNSERDFQDRLFAMARKEARVGVWWWEIDHDRLVWDNVMYDMFGVSEATWEPSYGGFQDCLHPDDRPWVNEMVSRCIANRTDYRAVFRVIKKNTGDLAYVRAYGSVMEGMNGPIFGGVNIEVTKDEYTGIPEEIVP